MIISVRYELQILVVPCKVMRKRYINEWKLELNSKTYRPLISGADKWICLSNRPGLIKAGSSTSGLFVPASTTTLVVVVKPISQTLLDNNELSLFKMKLLLKLYTSDKVSWWLIKGMCSDW